MGEGLGEHAPIEAFEAAWRVAAGAAPFPRYEAMPVHDAPYGAHAIGIEVVGEGDDFRYLFIGEIVRRHMMVDVAGLAMSMLPGRGPGSLVFANARRVYATAQPSRQSIAFIGVGSAMVETRQILAPCGPHGDRPSHLIGVIDFLPRRTAPTQPEQRRSRRVDTPKNG